MSSKVVPSGLHAIMALDPGGTTGVAAGHFELSGSVKDTLTKGRRMFKVLEVKGNWMQQVVDLEELFIRFRFIANSEHSIPLDRVHLVIENYTRRPQSADSNLDSVWVTAGLVAQLVDLGDMVDRISWQEPSDAKGFATNNRLRLWDLWTIGSEHCRDATRHMARHVAKLVQGA